MKKIIITFFFIMFTNILFCQQNNISKILEFPQGNLKEGFFFRKNVGEDDFSKNYICFDENGVFYNYQVDSHRMMKFDNKFNLIDEVILDLSKNPFIVSVKNGEYIFDTYYGGFKVFDKENNIISISMSKLIQNINGIDGKFYYNNQYNLLLFIDKNSDIHCIINPGINDEENRKNYKNPDETKKLFLKDSEYGKKGIIISNNTLYLDGDIYYWYGAQVNGYMFYTLDSNIYIYKNNEILKTLNLSSENESLESVAVHPCGDIYILRMNWQTNTHNLYYIENSWDSQWREQWYKDHPEVLKP